MNKSESRGGNAPRESITGHLFENAIERSPLALVQTQGASHVVHYVNPAFCRLCGTNKEHLIGLPLAVGVPACREDGCERLLDQVFSTGGVQFGEDLGHNDSAGGSVYWSYV